MAYNAVQQGAAASTWAATSSSPTREGEIAAVAAVVHNNMKPKEALTCSIR